MFCAVCGTQNRNDDKICVHCGDGLNVPKITDKIPFFGGKHQGVFCPNCRNSQYNENFCVNCGYNLKDVLGYYKIDKKEIDEYQYYLEINRNYLQIHLKDSSFYNIPEWEKFQFLYEKMSNIQITTCRGIISSKPCIKFEYEALKCSRFITPTLFPLCDGTCIKISPEKKEIAEIYDTISTLIKREKLSENKSL